MLITSMISRTIEDRG